MKDDFTRNILLVVALTAGLLVVDRLPGWLRRVNRAERLRFAIAQMHNGDLNTADTVTRANGYYEGIQHTVRIAPGAENEDYRLLDEFLRYEFKPNLKRAYGGGMRITNSMGMLNPEYGYEKPPHTRRIALLGDSVSAGPYRQDYVALLEDRLNQAQVTPEAQKYQILNFAVPGYIIGQKMEVALEKAPKFHPDVYVLQMSNLEAGGLANHISRLVASDLDLKYEFLKRIATQAGIRPKDPRSVVTYKLEPYYVPMTQWCLEQIRKSVAAQGARLVILLANPVVDADLSETQLADVHRAVDPLGVPEIDVADAFRGLDLPSLQIIPGTDIHPNVQGHEILFEKLYAKLLANPEVMTILTGVTASPADKGGKTTPR